MAKPQMQAEPKPPFPEQKLEKPGLESELKPKPRYKAPRYVAAGKLDGKVALVTGGIVHIASTLAIPYMGSATAFDRVSAGLKPNTMHILPPAAPGNELLPYNDPAHLLAVCPFDLDDGLLTVTATLPDPGWSLAIYSSQGDNFYAVAAAGLRQPEVTLVLEPSRATLLNLFGIGTAPNFVAGSWSNRSPRA